MSKAIDAISAAIDLAQGIGDPVKHIAAVRDLAKECEALALELGNKTIANSRLHGQLMSLHEGIRQLQQELEKTWEREYRRIPPLNFDVTCRGPNDDSYMRTLQMYEYRLDFDRMCIRTTVEQEEYDPKCRAYIARQMALHFEKALLEKLRAFRR